MSQHSVSDKCQEFIVQATNYWYDKSTKSCYIELYGGLGKD